MLGVWSRCIGAAHDDVPGTGKAVDERGDEAWDEETPTTTASDVGDLLREDTEETADDDAESGDAVSTDEEPPTERQLGPGLFPPAGADDDDEAAEDEDEDLDTASSCGSDPLGPAGAVTDDEASAGVVRRVEGGAGGFTPQETLFVVDWDDTILPSSWITGQGLRLDAGSVLSARQRTVLAPIASAAAAMLSAAKQRGTVVLLTNAERGWIELSCQKFLPTLLPTIEQMKIVSARTSYESRSCSSPLDWKVRAFEVEITRVCGADPRRRRNIHSLGDSIWEREALMRATAALPSCLAKSVKFAERPGVGQLLKQLDLVTASIDRIAQHDANLDLCITC